MTIPQDILDYKLQHWLFHQIDNLPLEQRLKLKSIRRCSTKPIPTKGEKPAVYLMSNGVTAKFFGHMTCKNPWACPVCTARVMSKYRSEIATMLDMLRDKKIAGDDFFAIGLTLTIPHLAYMKCKESTDILYNTWKYFTMKNFKREHGHAYHKFNQEIPIKFKVRVAEYTFGKNGWHPHFHCILWIERKNKDKVLDWQEKLNEFWLKCAKKYTLKYWKENNLHTNIDTSLEDLCDKLYSKLNNKHPAVKFSTNENGEILECLSSDYITGWGSDKELTGNIRKEASHSDHYTVYQVMLKAQDDEKYKDIFMDYLFDVTRKPVHHRVRRSPGLTKMIKNYRNTEGFKKVIEQKKTEDWRIILFFDSQQWSSLCYDFKNVPVLENILYLALKNVNLLYEYLDSLNVSYYLPIKNNFLQSIEDMFNHKSAAG